MSKTKLVISDLHVGNLTDFWSLECTIKEVARKMKRFSVKEVDLILLGDVHDFQSIYPTQVTLVRGSWQSYAAAGLIDWIVESLESNMVRVENVIIIEGNHDKRVAENMSLSEGLLHGLNDMGYKGKAFVSSYYIDEEYGVLYKHAVLMRSSGSYIYGISPRMIKEASKLMAKYGVKYVVTGHVHKFGYVKAFHGEGFVIAIPSFQIDLVKGENDRGALIMLDGDTPIFVEPSKTVKVVDEDRVKLEILEKLMEFIKRYRRKSSIPYHSCAIEEFYIGLHKPKEEGNNKIWWKYAIVKVGSKTRVVNGDLLKRVAEIYNAFDTTEEAIEHIMRVLRVNLSTARNYIWAAIKLELCKPKRGGRRREKKETQKAMVT